MSNQPAERLAEAVRIRCPEARTVPVDLPRLAWRLKVDNIAYLPIIEDGRLETDGSRARILVRKSSNATRQRFTIAHELGHLLLTQAGQTAVERRLTTDNEVERFCDQFAAALLLPRSWVSDCFGGKAQTLDTVRELARATDTSLAASLVRLQQTLGWRSMLLQWQITAGIWKFRWGAGVPNSMQSRVRATAETRELLDAIRNRTSRDVEIELPLQIRGRDGRWPAIVSCRGTSALALVKREL